MIDKNKIFGLFGDENKAHHITNLPGNELDVPFTKLGMFTKLIINHQVFHQKLEKFLKAEKPDYDVQEARRASEFTVFNRAWHYISKIDLEDRNHLEAIMDFKSKPFLLSLDQSIEYFQGPDIEEYEKCARLLEIKKLKEEIENPVTI